MAIASHSVQFCLTLGLTGSNALVSGWVGRKFLAFQRPIVAFVKIFEKEGEDGWIIVEKLDCLALALSETFAIALRTKFRRFGQNILMGGESMAFSTNIDGEDLGSELADRIKLVLHQLFRSKLENGQNAGASPLILAYFSLGLSCCRLVDSALFPSSFMLVNPSISCGYVETI